MRKRPITPIPQDAPLRDEEWLDLDGAAVVEVTSEEKDYPVESALVPGEMRGWRAAAPGTQTIRLIFDQPQRLTRIALVGFFFSLFLFAVSLFIIIIFFFRLFSNEDIGSYRAIGGFWVEVFWTHSAHCPMVRLVPFGTAPTICQRAH